MPPIFLSFFFLNEKTIEEKLFRLGPNLVGSREILLFWGREPFKNLLMFAR